VNLLLHSRDPFSSTFSLGRLSASLAGVDSGGCYSGGAVSMMCAGDEITAAVRWFSGFDGETPFFASRSCFCLVSDSLLFCDIRLNGEGLWKLKEVVVVLYGVDYDYGGSDL
jgi:hypothetical protein